MEQKCSHVNFLADLQPPLIQGGPMHPKRLLQAIGKLSPQQIKNKVLPVLFLLSLKGKYQPTLMEVSLQLQTMLGLRGGHFCLLQPCAFMGVSLLLPPFKFQKHPVLVCIQQVPTWLVEAFLSFKTSQFAPIVPWSAAIYKSKYKSLTKSFNLCKASHSSRHTFGSIYAALGAPLPILARYLIHVRESTTRVYVHDLQPGEYQLVVSHPDYFKPLSLQFAPDSHKVLECFPPKQALGLLHE